MTGSPAIPRLLLRLGVRQKMVLVLLSVLTVALSFTSWITVRDFQHNLTQETNKRGEDIANFLAQAITANVVAYDYQSMQLLLDKLVKSQDIKFARVLNNKGKEMASAGQVNVHSRTTDTIRDFSQPVHFDGEVVGEVIVGFDNRRVIAQLEIQKNNFILREIFIILLIAIGEFLALSYLIMRPVNVISRSLNTSSNTVEEIAPIPLSSNDEFGDLAKQFNMIRSQLAKANEQLQSKVDMADSKLQQTNQQLLRQSEELQRMNEQLKHLSITDPLTGLYNRRQFQELMNTEVQLSIRHNDPNSLLVIDIDYFKKINDQYGHTSGDQVLRHIAGLLVDNVRRSDMVCRVGGEEFVVCLRRALAEYALLVAEKLRKKIQDTPLKLGNEIIPVTISLGVSSIPGIGQQVRTAEELFDQADKALYYSKQSGRNRITHFQNMAKVSSEANT